MTGRRLGVGIVGANWAARGHLPGWRMLPERVEVKGICTRSRATAEAAATRLELPQAYFSFAEMLADPQIDIVSLGGPPPARVEMTLAALAAGKHVFTCVPFAVTLAQAERIVAAQRAAGTVGAIDAYFAWTPGLSALAEIVRDGALGELYAVNVDLEMAQFVMPRADYPYLWTGLAKNGTGVFENSCAHLIHLVREVFGAIESLVADSEICKRAVTLETGEVVAPDAADTGAITGRMANGALLSVRAGRAVPSGQGFALTAYGSKARMTARSPVYPLDETVSLVLGRPAPVTERNESHVAIAPHHKEVPGGLPATAATAGAAVSLGRLLAAMVVEIDGGPPCSPSFARALEVQRIVQAATTSARERRWVDIGEEGE